MKPVVIAMPGNERLTEELAAHLGLERDVATVLRFPDGECGSRRRSTRGTHSNRIALAPAIAASVMEFLP